VVGEASMLADAPEVSAYGIALAQNLQLPADFIDWEAHMSIKATAVVKKESKVDPKKPNDKAYYASLLVLNENGKPYGLPRYLSEFREVAVLLTREAGVTHEQLHERFCRVRKGRRNQVSSDPRKRRSNRKSWVRPQGSMTEVIRVS
jgi:hypothetical protein